MQTFLDLHRRPVVRFDPSNAEHRRFAAIFLREGSWTKCPYAFYAPDDLSIRSYAIEILAEYYLNQEFSKKDKKVLKKINSKSNKVINISAVG
jgi:hypothetical protein